MENEIQKKKIFVGVSGGVDSSVVLALLQNQGHEVTGVFIRTWQPDWIECTWREERRDAMRICAHLDVPFVELDLEREYKEGVADYMVREYRAGRTPNPDVMCNREVKFGGFLSWALEQGADMVATGHYAKTAFNHRSGKIELLRGKDIEKDQSYFLWMVDKDQLPFIMFPLGDMEKSFVREKAKHFGLSTARKKDSQGICFIGDIDMKDFLRHYIDEEEGHVLNGEGQVIGSHKGALFYTLSERHGFTIHPSHKGTQDAPYYVIAKNIDDNTITVSQNPERETVASSVRELVEVVDNQDIFKEGMRLQAQIRYRGEVMDIEIKEYNKNEKKMTVVMDQADYSLASGQSLVIYDGRLCLGGGIVT